MQSVCAKIKKDRSRIVEVTLSAVAAVALAACNSDGGGGSGVAPIGPIVEGVYSGTLQTGGGTADTLFAMMDLNGNGVVVDQTNPAIFRLEGATGSNDVFISQFIALAGAGVTFPNGEAVDFGNFAGTLVQGKSITGTASIDGMVVAMQTQIITNSFVLNYNTASSAIPASFAALAGTYGFSLGTTTVSLTFTNSGTFTGQDNANCSYEGKVVVPNPTINVYEIAGTQTCPALAAALTGVASLIPAAGGQSATLQLELDNNLNVGFFVEATQS